VIKHTKSALSEFNISSSRFQDIHLDIVGPLSLSHGNRFLLTMVDRFTRWPEAVPLTEISTEAVLAAFMATWVARFGCPATVVTDRGAQFTSKAWRSTLELLGIQHRATTAYHPQANGMVERFHRQLKVGLATHHSDWVDRLPFVLLGLRSAVKEDLAASPAQLTFGTTLRLPGDFFIEQKNLLPPDQLRENLASHFDHLKALPPRQQQKQAIFIPKDLFTTTQVFVRVDAVKKSLQPPYDGPYQVIKRDDKYFTLLINGTPKTVSIDRLKPAFLADSTVLPETDLDPAAPCFNPVPQLQESSLPLSNTSASTTHCHLPRSEIQLQGDTWVTSPSSSSLQAMEEEKLDNSAQNSSPSLTMTQTEPEKMLHESFSDSSPPPTLPNHVEEDKVPPYVTKF